MKKKKRKLKVSKKEVSIQRKLLRKKRKREDHSSGVLFDESRYQMAVATIKRKLLVLADDIMFLLANAGHEERHQDLKYAREYIVFARERMGDTEYIFTDSEIPQKKRKLNRPKKKGKLNRRRTP